MSLFSNTVKSVESITANLAKTVKELEDHAAQQLQHANLKQAEAAAADLAHKLHVAEHDAAQKVAANIKALLGA